MSDKKETKMVIIVRSDLKNAKGEKVRSGKIIAQGAHAALGFVWKNVNKKKICFEMSDEQFNWYTTGQTKIVLKAKDEKELIAIYQAAKDAGLSAELITDSGRTEFSEPTKTCLSIGPEISENIDLITGHLSLY